MIELLPVHRLTKRLVRLLSLLCLSGLIVLPATLPAEDGTELHPLRTISPAKIDQLFPSGTHILIERGAIETFLAELEGPPPNWTEVYGQGHHDPGHDERLFNLNRERDGIREGNPVLNWRVAFVWPGELSQFDPDTNSYTIAVGPEFTATRWGLVRFKPEELPSNLRVKADKPLGDRIRRSLDQHEKVSVFVVLAGPLIPTESIIYDFSHEEEGVGLIMPVVKVEQVEVLLVERQAL